MGYFCSIAIPKEELKIVWSPVVIYYRKISFLIDLSKMMIYLILTHSSILCFKWQYLRYREYPAKCHQRKRHFFASRNDNYGKKKGPIFERAKTYEDVDQFA